MQTIPAPSLVLAVGEATSIPKFQNRSYSTKCRWGQQNNRTIKRQGSQNWPLAALFARCDGSIIGRTRLERPDKLVVILHSIPNRPKLNERLSASAFHLDISFNRLVGDLENFDTIRKESGEGLRGRKRNDRNYRNAGEPGGGGACMPGSLGSVRCESRVSRVQCSNYPPLAGSAVPRQDLGQPGQPSLRIGKVRTRTEAVRSWYKAQESKSLWRWWL